MEDVVDRHICCVRGETQCNRLAPNAKLVIWSAEPETYFRLLPNGLLCQIHTLDSSQLIPSILISDISTSLSENQWAACASLRSAIIVWGALQLAIEVRIRQANRPFHQTSITLENSWLSTCCDRGSPFGKCNVEYHSSSPGVTAILPPLSLAVVALVCATGRRLLDVMPRLFRVLAIFIDDGDCWSSPPVTR